MIDASGGSEAAGGVTAKRGGVGGENDGNRVGNTVGRAFFHTMEIEQALDAAAAVCRSDISRVQIAGGGAGMIEMVDFADVKFAAGVEADAGGDGLAVFLHGGEDGRGAGGKLLAGPIFIEALFLEDSEQLREMDVVWSRQPVE